MTPWLGAAIALGAGLLPCAIVCSRERPLEGIVALEVAGVVAALALLLMAEAFRRQPFVELALVLAVMSFAGALAFLRYAERHR